jgi:hypothetical protein
MERGQFTFYRSYYEAIKQLKKADQAAVLMAICAYALDEEMPGLTGTPAAIFAECVPTIATERRLSAEGRRCVEYKTWRKRVFERDDYTCRRCGARGVRLNAHHTKPYALFPELRYCVENGITLCVACHKEEHRGKR